MKIVVAFLVGLLCGAAVSWWLVPGRYRHLYQTTQPLVLTNNDGQGEWVLPEGTPLLADVKLTRTPDLGWWGFAPVLFDDMWKAQDLGVTPWDGGGEIWERITLNVSAPDGEEPLPSADADTSTDPSSSEDSQSVEPSQP